MDHGIEQLEADLDKRSEILDFAEKAARANGCHSFSFEHIAENVGLKKPSLFHYFRNKQELIQSMFRRYSDMIRSVLLQISNSGGTGAEQIQAYVTANKSLVEEGNSVCLSVALGLEDESSVPGVQNDLAGFHQLNIEWLTRTFEIALRDGSIPDLTDPAEEAYACLALMDGAQLMARSKGSDIYFDKAVAQYETRLAVKH